MTVENILTNKTVSFTELRDPAKVLAYAGDSPVAILNRNNVVGYLVPKEAVSETAFKNVDKKKLQQTLKDSQEEVQPVLDYLKDK